MQHTIVSDIEISSRSITFFSNEVPRGGSYVYLRSTSKKRGGSRRGSNFGPNVKKPTSWAKKGGLDLPRSAHEFL